MNAICRYTILTIYLIGISGCSILQTKPSVNWIGYTEKGKASFYANRHQNRKTASGEPYKYELQTAAHKELPFGSMVRVTNLDNGKSVIVKINDRGPFAKGRIIDLSRSAFQKIGNTSKGIIEVQIEVLK
jgi:rare lipoprotein A